MHPPLGIHCGGVGRIATVDFLHDPGVDAKPRVVGRVGFRNLVEFGRIQGFTGPIAALAHLNSPRFP
jgi:hypothetical protein